MSANDSVKDDWKATYGVDIYSWAKCFMAEIGPDGLLVNHAWYANQRALVVWSFSFRKLSTYAPCGSNWSSIKFLDMSSAKRTVGNITCTGTIVVKKMA
jgi:hypothetical protein